MQCRKDKPVYFFFLPSMQTCWKALTKSGMYEDLEKLDADGGFASHTVIRNFRQSKAG